MNNANGEPTLATGGSGDVLCGSALGFLAQRKDPLPTTTAAVRLIGAPAAVFGPEIVAEDQPDLPPGAFRRRSPQEAK